MPLLEVVDLCAGYERLEVLHGVSLAVEERGLYAVVGANGAGKTTLLLALSGIVAVRRGRIRFDGSELARMPPHEIARRGLAHVPEGRRMLAPLSVEENLLLAARGLSGAARRAGIARMYERFPNLRERRKVPSGSLSGGEQQMLAIARALVTAPRLLVLDEPSMGLAPKLVDAVFEIIREEHARGTTIVLVEQNARKALAIADEACVLERGTITLRGSGAELLHHPEVVDAYLGRT